MAKQLHTIQMRVSEFSLHLMKNLSGLIPFRLVVLLKRGLRCREREMNLKLFKGHCDSGLSMIADKGPKENSDKGEAED